MKRSNGDLVGRPKRIPTRRDVAGSSLPPVELDVACYRHAMENFQLLGSVPLGGEESISQALRDAALVSDLRDFLAGGLLGEGVAEQDVAGGSSLRPDPIFRDRLRRRLWQSWVMTQMRDPGERH